MTVIHLLIFTSPAVLIAVHLLMVDQTTLPLNHSSWINHPGLQMTEI